MLPLLSSVVSGFCFSSEMAPHSSTLAWKIPWAEEPGGLQSMGSRRVRHDWATSLSLFTFMHWRRKWQPTRVLAWRIPGTGKPGGLLSMGSHRVGHDRSDLAAAEACHFLSSLYFSAPRGHKCHSARWLELIVSQCLLYKICHDVIGLDF